MSAAELITEPVSRWEGGFMFDPPLGIGPGQLRLMCDPTYSGVNYYRQCAPITVDAFSFTFGEVMSTFSKNVRDLYTRTRDGLLAYEGVYVEIAFVSNPWLGSIDYPYLLNPSNAFLGSAVAMNVVDAFAKIEDEIMLSGINTMRPTIFVTPRAMAHLARHQLVRREGNVWLSPMDSIVVPLSSNAFTGQEPPGGSAPGTDQEYMYATTGVQIRRSELLVYPEQEPPTAGNPFGYPASAVDRQTNNIAVSTQRIYGISFVGNTYDFPVVYALADYTIPHL